jgi:hypothetical protein
MTDNEHTFREYTLNQLTAIQFPDEIFPVKELASVFKYLQDHNASFSRLTRKDRGAGTFTEQLRRSGDIIHSIESIGPISNVELVISNWTEEQNVTGACFIEGEKYGDVKVVSLANMLDGRLELNAPVGLPIMWLPYSLIEVRYTAIGVHTFRINYITVRDTLRRMGENDLAFGVLTDNGGLDLHTSDKAACHGIKITVGGQLFEINGFRLIKKEE